MLAPLLSPIPAINIEFAAEQMPFKEPSSPFDKLMFGSSIIKANNNSSNSLDAYRSTHLVPPPVHSPKDHVRPVVQVANRGQGLDPARFEALRMASRIAPKADLRKELAIRAHQSKQIERRNRFLSKIEALPSPTAASLPVTPPESPAVFHFTLPSPGLVSPLALFETLDDGDRDSRPVRIEQVDFRSLARKDAEALAALTGNMKQSLEVHGLSVPKKETPAAAATATAAKPTTPFNQSLPSLDQISKRLGGNVTITRSPSPVSRLPAFLQRNAPNTVQEPVPVAPAAKLTPTGEHGPIARPTSATGTKVRPPVYPGSVTLPGPRIASTRAPTPLTAEALNALAFRAERGSAMVERLQRRFSAPARMTQPQSNMRTLARPIGGF